MYFHRPSYFVNVWSLNTLKKHSVLAIGASFVLEHHRQQCNTPPFYPVSARSLLLFSHTVQGHDLRGSTRCASVNLRGESAVRGQPHRGDHAPVRHLLHGTYVEQPTTKSQCTGTLRHLPNNQLHTHTHTHHGMHDAATCAGGRASGAGAARGACHRDTCSKPQACPRRVCSCRHGYMACLGATCVASCR